MRKAKDATGTAKKSAAKRTRRGPVKAAKAKTTRGPTPARRRKPAAPEAPAPEAPTPEVAAGEAGQPAEHSISEAQSNVVASKFRTDTHPPKPAVRPTLPTSYGESHLLLLVRDPQMLFAAWDMSPSVVESLKARMGARALAVSTLTLRLTRAGGGTEVIHVGKKARSRYLKIDGGPSFVAEIGFTTPAGRFELVARSTPCFVPQGTLARGELLGVGRRAVLGYREARSQAIQGREKRSRGSALAPAEPGESEDGGSSPAGSLLAGPMIAGSATPGSAIPGSSTPGAAALRSTGSRVIGGSSDLYRR